MLSGFQDLWEADPTTEVKAIDPKDFLCLVPEAQMMAETPDQKTPKKEWTIIPLSTERPDLTHHSDNPYDFLSAVKLDKLICFWNDEAKAKANLTRVDTIILGKTSIKKMLAKVAYIGSIPMDKQKKDAWICSAIVSILAQKGKKIEDFTRACLAVNPAKPGYYWIVFPVKFNIFNALEKVRRALDPRSGTLVLFRPWKDKPIPIQRVYATSIHSANDEVSFEVATSDYAKQMKTALETNNMRILSMTPANYGDAGSYCTKIKFGFAEGAKTFLINHQRLTRRFWTGSANSKGGCSIEYKWPSKCRICESESHITMACPWKDFGTDDHKPNFYNCRHHTPGWVEPLRKEKSRVPDAPTRVIASKPKQTRPGKASTEAGKSIE